MAGVDGVSGVGSDSRGSDRPRVKREAADASSVNLSRMLNGGNGKMDMYDLLTIALAKKMGFLDMLKSSGSDDGDDDGLVVKKTVVHEKGSGDGGDDDGKVKKGHHKNGDSAPLTKDANSYTVKSGDTLYDIVKKKYDLTDDAKIKEKVKDVAKKMNLNGGKDLEDLNSDAYKKGLTTGSTINFDGDNVSFKAKLAKGRAAATPAPESPDTNASTPATTDSELSSAGSKVKDTSNFQTSKLKNGHVADVFKRDDGAIVAQERKEGEASCLLGKDVLNLQKGVGQHQEYDGSGNIIPGAYKRTQVYINGNNQVVSRWVDSKGVTQYKLFDRDTLTPLKNVDSSEEAQKAADEVAKAAKAAKIAELAKKGKEAGAFTRFRS